MLPWEPYEEEDQRYQSVWPTFLSGRECLNKSAVTPPPRVGVCHARQSDSETTKTLLEETWAHIGGAAPKDGNSPATSLYRQWCPVDLSRKTEPF